MTLRLGIIGAWRNEIDLCRFDWAYTRNYLKVTFAHL